MDFDLLQKLIIIATFNSILTCAFIQETKAMFKSSKWIKLYSFVINMAVGIVFCLSFTDISLSLSPWVGFISFIGADAIYNAFEGKLKSFRDLIPTKEEVIDIPRGDI